jgi:hypothetical protein
MLDTAVARLLVMACQAAVTVSIRVCDAVMHEP